jgi:hypothetical protein
MAASPASTIFPREHWATGSSDQMHSNDNAKSEVLQKQGKHSQLSEETAFQSSIPIPDYQTQLMLLTQQNTKRLMLERENGKLGGAVNKRKARAGKMHS